MHNQVKEFAHELLTNRHFTGEFRNDTVSKVLYSTDASIYQINPLGVLIPKNTEDLAIAVETAGNLKLPMIPRGSGSGLAGQAIGAAIIIDCSKYLNRCIEFNDQEEFAVVEPGMILSNLNRIVGRKGLQFGPDPASAERATIGGCIANNAAGAHSIIYGLTVDHLLGLDIIYSDGTQSYLTSVDLHSAHNKAQAKSRIEGIFYQQALEIRNSSAGKIREKWPQTWRRVSGYNLNYLLPWSSSKPPMWDMQFRVHEKGIKYGYPPVNLGEINLATLIAGSEGTLGVIRAAKLRLVPKLSPPILVVLPYKNIETACDMVSEWLTYNPSAIELIPEAIIRLARSVPAYASQLAFVNNLGDGSAPAAMLVIELSGEAQSYLPRILQKSGGKYFIAKSAEEQKNVWNVRKVGLGLLMSSHGTTKPVAFIEDMAVPVRNLSLFVKDLNQLFLEHETQAEMYAHASAGCLHIRPLINLKDAKGKEKLRVISKQAAHLALFYGGAISAEHGDGISRSEWLELAYGGEIVQHFKNLKSALDPNNLLNPGKIVDPMPMDSMLRYDHEYSPEGWEPVLNFPISGKDGIVDAIEQCNGAGVCRKEDGIMCPTFQATREEMHSTRGRANLLRSYISARTNRKFVHDLEVKEALDLCLACKGCKSECPSSVDMAKLKYEFLNHFYHTPGHHHKIRDYIFGYIHILGKLGIQFQPLANKILASFVFKEIADSWFGISKQRSLPLLASKPLKKLLRSTKINKENLKNAIFLTDAFGQYFLPEATFKAIQVLSLYGFKVIILSTVGAGRTLISKGFLEPAKQHAKSLFLEINRIDPDGTMPIIGVEPSEIYTLRDEFLDLIPASQFPSRIAERSWTIEEFLVRTDKPKELSNMIGESSKNQEVLFHSHCYQKSLPTPGDGFPYGAEASVKLLNDFGYIVNLINDGCCGVAGAFGYEKEHFETAMKVGNLFLIPALTQKIQINPAITFSASGVSCQAQIEHGSHQKAYHPIELVYSSLKDYMRI